MVPKGLKSNWSFPYFWWGYIFPGTQDTLIALHWKMMKIDHKFTVILRGVLCRCISGDPLSCSKGMEDPSCRQLACFRRSLEVFLIPAVMEPFILKFSSLNLDCFKTLAFFSVNQKSKQHWALLSHWHHNIPQSCEREEH